MYENTFLIYIYHNLCSKVYSKSPKKGYITELIKLYKKSLIKAQESYEIDNTFNITWNKPPKQVLHSNSIPECQVRFDSKSITQWIIQIMP